jgi:hypothetical protein
MVPAVDQFVVQYSLGCIPVNLVLHTQEMATIPTVLQAELAGVV